MKWIQWMLDNAWSVVIVGGVLLQLLQAVMKKKGGGAEAQDEEPPKEYEFEDSDLAERTRKIREEIQRKIEQRTRGQTERPVPVEPKAPPPIIREVTVSLAPVQAASRLDAQRQAEILEQQAAMMERLREAEVMKQGAQKRMEFETATADHTAEVKATTRSTVLGDLRDPESLRRAFILREVLGPPVALKR